MPSKFPNLPIIKERFLEAYARVGTVTHAARAVGATRQTINKWRRLDPEFNEAMAHAFEANTEALEATAFQRALGAGGTKASDILLIFLLKARRPDVYADRMDMRSTVHTTHGIDESDIDKELNRLIDRKRGLLNATRASMDESGGGEVKGIGSVKAGEAGVDSGK